MQEPNKSILRNDFRARRANVPIEERTQAGARIRALLLDLPQTRHVRSVLLYLSAKGEVDTWPLLDHFWGQDVTVLLPRCRKHAPGLMDIHVVRSPQDLGPGAFGLTEPLPETTTRLTEPRPDLIVLPALAFDHRGYRLGYGGGYYDRFLCALPPDTCLVGLAYAFQVVPRLPADAWDIPVHHIITETAVITTEHLA